MDDIVLENKYVRYVLDREGWNKSFFDKMKGVEYSIGASDTPFISMTKRTVSPGGDTTHKPTSINHVNGKIFAKFETFSANARLVIDVEEKPHYFHFGIKDLNDHDVDHIDLINLDLDISQHIGNDLSIRWNDDFAVCLLALNLQTDSEGGNLVARCCQRHGLIADLALIAVPTSKIHAVIQEVEADQGLPSPIVDGRWAKISDISKKSYLFIQDIAESNADEVVTYAKEGGFATILISDTCWSESLGHYLPHRQNFPSGLKGIRKVVEKIHRAGLKAGLHIHTTVVSPNDPYIAPIPDKRLAKSLWIPLATPVDEETTFIPTTIPPTEFPSDVPVGKWTARYGVHIQIGDEIISYCDTSLTPPYGFIGCKRGALGTRAVTHSPDSEPLIYHLLQIFGDFVYDAETSILDEVAVNIVRVFDSCKFDMLYYDASERLQSEEEYYKAKIQTSIYNRLKSKSIFFQSSSYTNHTWHIMSSHVTSDGVRRERERYVDYSMVPGIMRIHDDLMTGYLGWYRFYEDTSIDEIEYLCQKSVGFNAPIALWTFSSTLDNNPNTEKILALMQLYETLRLRNALGEETKKKVRKPGVLYRIAEEKGEWEFIKPSRVYCGGTSERA